jgi:hypothetical protein
MRNLYWKAGGQTRSLVEQPFASEADLERYVFENQDLLGGDIYIVFRQVRTGNRQGIPDMIGVDQDARVCIIELKNVEADESVLPQALGYAAWAETSPDSIKAIWLESKRRPEDVTIDFDNLDIRIILIAPSFTATVPRLAGKIGYPLDLFQLQRYALGQDEFVLVEVLPKMEGSRAKVTKIRGDWDWEYYASEHGAEATAQFRKAVEALAALAKEQGWGLEYNLNKYYTGFKLGNKVVFGVNWGGTYAWNISAKLPEGTADSLRGKHWEFQRYDRIFGNAVLRSLQPDHVDIKELEPLLLQAYKRVSGV